MTMHTRQTVIPAEQVPLMLHIDDLDTIRKALTQPHTEPLQDADRILRTVTTARRVMRMSGAGALTMRPLKSIGGMG